jgi:hypothetical protein
MDVRAAYQRLAHVLYCRCRLAALTARQHGHPFARFAHPPILAPLGAVVPSYRFTGHVRTGYFAYRDLATGKMLTADPGGVYEMQSVTLMDAVPPADGRWEAVAAPAATLPVTLPPPPPPAPAAVEDAEPEPDDSPAE